jgi:hypothetical protein
MDPYSCYLFSRLEPLLFLPCSPLIYPHEAEGTLFQTYDFSENLVVLGIEPGISASVVRNSDHQTTEAEFSGQKLSPYMKSIPWLL